MKFLAVVAVLGQLALVAMAALVLLAALTLIVSVVFSDPFGLGSFFSNR